MQQTSLFRLIVLAGLAVAVVLVMSPGAAFGQDNVYLVSYFSNNTVSGAPDATLRLVNDGVVSDASPDGDLCAAIYVFNHDQQMKECCSCLVTPNGLLTLSVRHDLTNNPVTGPTTIPSRGVVKVLSSLPVSGVCDPRSNNFTLQIGIRAWLTHIQRNGTGFSITEEELTDSTLGASEFQDLQDDCFGIISEGSGFGECAGTASNNGTSSHSSPCTDRNQ